MRGAFEDDSVQESKALSANVEDPVDIEGKFVSLTYYKGAAIINMLENVLGSRAFRTGLLNYLREMQFKNADQDDLWRHLGKAQEVSHSSVDIKKVMDTWTLKAGYPLVTLTRNYMSNSARLSQQRFLIDGQSRDEKADSGQPGLWQIPITYTTEEEHSWKPITRFWLNARDAEVCKDHLPAAGKWIVLNPQYAGFYRVNYDPQNWNLLINQLIKNHYEIPVETRAQIVDDIWSLAKIDEVPYTMALNCTKYVKSEQEYLPIIALVKHFESMNQIVIGTELYVKWKNFALYVLEHAYFTCKSGEKYKGDLYCSRLQASLQKWMCLYDHQECVEERQKLFKRWIESDEKFKLDAKSQYDIICTAIRNGDEKLWNLTWNKYQKSNAKMLYLSVPLWCTTQERLLERLLRAALDSASSLRNRDAMALITYTTIHNRGTNIPFKFLAENWEKIVAL